MLSYVLHFRRVHETCLCALLTVSLPCDPNPSGFVRGKTTQFPIDLGRTFPHARNEMVEWEHFLVCQLGCAVGARLLNTSKLHSQSLLPPFTSFLEHEAALATELLRTATLQEDFGPELLNWIRGVQILATTGAANLQAVSVGKCFLQSLFDEINGLPCVQVPPHCRPFAALLGVKLHKDAEACIVALRRLRELEVDQTERYFQWLGELQRSQRDLQGDWSQVSTLEVFTRDPKPGFTRISNLVLALEATPGDHQIGDEAGEDLVQMALEGMLLAQSHTEMRLVSSTQNIQYLSFCQFFRRCGCRPVPDTRTVMTALQAMVADAKNYYNPGSGVPTVLVKKEVQHRLLCLYVLLELLLYRDERMRREVSEAGHPRIGAEALVFEPRRRKLEDEYRWRFALDTLNSPPAENIAGAATSAAVVAVGAADATCKATTVLSSSDLDIVPILLRNGTIAVDRTLCIACMIPAFCRTAASMRNGDTVINCLNIELVQHCPVSLCLMKPTHNH